MIRWMHRMGWRLSALALLALVVRALVPAGYMLAEADTGSGRYLTMKLCDAHGAAPRVVDLETGRILDAPAPVKDAGKSNNQSSPCVFATLPPMAPPETEMEPVVFVVVQQADFIEMSGLRPGRGIAAPPPPSTGPPFFA